MTVITAWNVFKDWQLSMYMIFSERQTLFSKKVFSLTGELKTKYNAPLISLHSVNSLFSVQVGRKYKISKPVTTSNSIMIGLYHNVRIAAKECE